MRFDDRLATVLHARIGGPASARTQLRQLVDLLGTLPSDARGTQIDAAYVRLDELSRLMPAADRARALAEPGLRLRSPRLLAQLAATEPPVAAAALGAARLSEGEWLDLIPALPIASRWHVRQRRDLGPKVDALMARLGIVERGLPPASDVRPIPANDAAPIAAPVSQPGGQHIEGIGAIVQRIEAYRKRQAESGGSGATIDEAQAANRAAAGPITAVASAPLGSFAFSCDEAARIIWADATAAAAVLGLSIAARDDTSPSTASSAVTAAIRRRQPIRAGQLEMDGAPAIAGQWRLDAMPQFDTLGRFTGYIGKMRRPVTPRSAPTASHEGDLLRQLLHELRTPVNAIQGFAEVIQQQLFGPTPHEYRAHAAAIAGDAAKMLSGFDDLERLARLDTGATTMEAGQCDLVAVVSALVDRLCGHMAQRSSGFAFASEEPALFVEIDPLEAERLVWRMLATLAGAAAPGEAIKLRLRRRGGMVRLVAALPASLSAQDDIFHAAAPASQGPLSAGMFGTGFALRLTASEARSAGGKLERTATKLRLELPEVITCLTPEAAGHTESKGLAG